MKKLLKITALLLSVIMLVLSFAACKDGGETADSSAESTQQPSDDSSEVPVDSNVLSIISDSKSAYVLSCSQDAEQTVKLALEELQTDIKDITGCSMATSIEKNGNLIPEADKEIFIGQSAREVYAPLYEDLDYGEWRIKAVGDSIVLAANTVSATLDAVEHFVANFIKDKKIEVPKDYEYKKEAEFTVESIKLGGVDLSEYSIAYRASNVAAVRAMSDLIWSVGRASGIDIKTVKASANMDVAKTIVIGQTIDHKVKTTEYGECKVYVEGTTIYVDGGDIVGLETGISYLASLLVADKTVNVELSKIAHESKLQARSEYVNDATKFNVCYSGRIETPAEKLSLSYKIKQLYDPKGEVVVIAHRGEHTYYPENSLEGLISAWRIGAFATEFDIRKTKDGHWIAMHDDTLTRTTNVATARVADPTLPKSNNASDWTLEEIRKLKLLDEYGAVTPFIVPTLEEGLIASDDRIFFHLDKVFDYENDILPLMIKTDVFESVYLVNNISYKGIENFIKYVKDTYGKTMHSMPRTNTITQLKECAAMANKDGALIAPSIVYLGDYVKASVSDNERIRDIYSSQARVATWVLREADYENVWREARSYNYSIFLTDHPYEFLQTIK